MKVIKTSTSALVCIGLAGLSLPAQASQSQDIEKLSEQIRQLQENVRQLQAKQDEDQTRQKAAAAAAALPANVPKGYWGIPGTNTSIRVGGALLLEGMFDTGQKGPEGTIANGVTVNSPNAASNSPYRKGYSRFSAKYTQLELATRTDFKDGPSLDTFVSMDFAGTTSSNPLGYSTTNAYIPRLREAYFKYGNWQVGQTAPLFGDPGSITEPLDAGLHHAGMNLNRMPLVRYNWNIDKQNYLGVELVGPSSSYTNYNNVQESDYDSGTAGARALSSVPDLGVAYRYEDDWGHVMLHGMMREIRADDGAQTSTSVLGWGTGLTGHFNIPGKTDLLGGGNRFNYGINYGSAIGNYITDQGYQGAVMDSRNELHAIRALGFYGGYTHVWSENWRTSARYSRSQAEDSSLLTPAAAAAWNTRLDLAAANVV